MTSRDCLEYARLRERSAAFFADWVAAKDELAISGKSDRSIRAKKKELKHLAGQMRESHRLSDVHRDFHKVIDSN
jgi:ABC-type transport system involved in cytochrome bd biosynthesis fused ATPase/permease subunit